MFFNMQGSDKEKFVVGKIFPKVRDMKNDFSALEWQPLDARGTRYFNAMDPNCANYYAAAKLDSWPSTRQDEWKSRGGRDDKVAVTFMEFVPPKPLELKAGTVDIALLQPSAATDMGKKLYRLIFRETARVLRRQGQFLVFTASSESLPETAENFFEIEEESNDNPDGVTYYLLTRKARRKKKQDEAQKPRRKVLGFTLNELEDALDD